MKLIIFLLLAILGVLGYLYFQKKNEHQLDDYLGGSKPSEKRRFTFNWKFKWTFPWRKIAQGFSRKEPRFFSKNTASHIEGGANDLVVLSIIPEHGRQFSSYELLQALMNARLHFGAMDIFHRHEIPNGQGAILFSVASLTNPGTFDIHNMGNFSCSGLSLFADMRAQQNPVYTFDLMLDTAYQLADELGGTLLEGQRDQWTEYSAQFIRGKLQAAYGVASKVYE